VLRLSEDAAFNRIEVARAARDHPVVLEMLLMGTLSPTTARLLARRLTPQNHQDLLAAASGKSKQQVEELLARRFPHPDVPSSIRSLPVSASLGTKRNEDVTALPEVAACGPPGADSPPAALWAAGPHGAVSESRPLVRPLAADRYEVRFTASAETRDYLRRAQDLLGHAIPGGDLDQVFNRALRLLVRELERKKFACTERPRRSRGQSVDSRNIPAGVKRAVRQRDGDGCAWVAPNEGGKPTVDRIRLLCRTHNGHEAEVFYGPGRRYGRTGADVAGEAFAGYGAVPKMLPVLERVTKSKTVLAASLFNAARRGATDRTCADG
jgi:hypothetical protein